MRGYDEGVSAQIPLKLNTHVFLCASICVCIGLPRLVRTVINPASLKGDSSLKPRSLRPPTIVVSFLSHTHTKAPNRKQIPPALLGYQPLFSSSYSLCRAVAAINKPWYVDITFSNTSSEILSFKPQMKMPEPVYGKTGGFGVLQRILGQPVRVSLGQLNNWRAKKKKKPHQPCTVWGRLLLDCL